MQMKRGKSSGYEGGHAGREIIITLTTLFTTQNWFDMEDFESKVKVLCYNLEHSDLNRENDHHVGLIDLMQL
jgi:hypothetical protein